MYTHTYIYMLNPPMNYREVPRYRRQSSYVWASGVWSNFEVPSGEHMYDGSRLHFQSVATLHADTPRDDKRWKLLSEYPKINIGASSNPKIAFTVVSDQSRSNTYEWQEPWLTPVPKQPYPYHYPAIRPYIGLHGDSSILFLFNPKDMPDKSTS